MIETNSLPESFTSEAVASPMNRVAIVSSDYRNPETDGGFRYSRRTGAVSCRAIAKAISLSLFSTLALVCLSMLAPTTVSGQDDLEENPPRPATEQLLPETTVVFFQIADVKDMAEKYMAGSAGQFFNDENIAPLVGRLWEEGKSLYDENALEEVGLSLEEIGSLPSGEMTIAVIAPRRKKPVIMVLFELDDENPAVDKALNRVREVAADEGEGFTDIEKENGITYEKTMIDDTPMITARKDGLMVACTDEKVLDNFFKRWMGEEVKKVRPLSENRKFITIMNRCASKKGFEPEARFFVDPITLAKSAGRGNVGMAAGMAFLPTLGLDGLNGIGGAMVLGDDEYEFIAHAHVLLASPRKGIMEMISLKPAYYEPESWMPSDTHFYTTTSWDVDQMYAELTKMVDLFTEEGNFEKLVDENINENLNLNLKEDVLDLFTGRITIANSTVRPITLNSASTIVGLQLKDPEGAREYIEEKFKTLREENEDFEADDVEFVEHDGIKFWCSSQERYDERQERMAERMRERAERRGRPSMEGSIRFPDPCVGFVGDCVIYTDSRESMKHIIDVHNGSASALRDDDEYLKMSSHMTRLLDSDMPCAMAFNQPAKQMEMWFEFANADTTKDFINGSAASAAENEEMDFGGEFMTTLKDILDENPVPEFGKVKKYFQPNGWFMTTDDTGYHVLMFQERLKLPVGDE